MGAEKSKESGLPPYNENRRILSLAALALLALQPLLAGILPRADALFHLHRLAELSHMVNHGLLFPRWLPDLGYGYGFPLFNYYAPLSYYFALPMLVLGPKAALLFDMAAALLLLTVATYLLARDRFGVEAGLVAALLVAYAPYTLYDLYQRGALAELWGLAFLVLTLWTIERAARSSYSAALAHVALSYAALMLSHNITAMIGTPILWGYALFCAAERHSKAIAWRLSAALLLGLGLSAFFWLPAFAEKGYVHIENLYTQSRFDFHNHFLTLRALLAPPHPVDPAMVNPPVPITLGWPALLLALVAWLLPGRSLQATVRRTRLLLTLGLIGAVGMVMPLSRPIWEHLPLLRFVQFPWRLLGEADVALAMLGGLGASRLLAGPSRAKRATLLLPLFYLIIALYALPWLFPGGQQPSDDLSPATIIRTEITTGGIGTTAAGDYLPRWVQVLPSPERMLARYAENPTGPIPRLDVEALPEGVKLLSARWEPVRAILEMDVTTSFRLVLDWFYFPGWQAWVDGQSVAVEPWGESGLLSLTLPQGTHRITVAFGETPLRHGADLLSLLAAGIWLMVLALTPSASRRRRSPAPPAWLPSALHRALVVALLLLAMKGCYLDRADTFLAPHRFDGNHIKGIGVPLDFAFGSQMCLLGFDPPPQPLTSERDAPLALYWAASPPVAKDYSVGLYLIDDAGHLYGQNDHQNPGDYPTSRLDAAHYIRDEYLLRPFIGTPPGRYRIAVSLYDQRTQQQLPIVDQNGAFIGTRAPIATVEVARPSTFPPPTALPRDFIAEADLGDGIRYLGGSAVPEILNEGEPFTLVLYWQAYRPPRLTQEVGLLWLDGEGRPFAVWSWLPGGESHPPTTWAEGEIVRDVVEIIAPIMPESLAHIGPNPVRLSLKLVGGPDAEGLATEIGELTLRRPARQWELPRLDARCEGQWSFGNLRGYRLEPAELRIGEPFTMTLYWEGREPADRPLVAFVHLVRDGKIVAQDDAPPVRGERPTTSWLRGEVIADPHPLLVPPGNAAGCYFVRIGFYDPRTFRRGRMLDGDDILTCPDLLHLAAP